MYKSQVSKIKFESAWICEKCYDCKFVHEGETSSKYHYCLYCNYNLMPPLTPELYNLVPSIKKKCYQLYVKKWFKQNNIEI